MEDLKFNEKRLQTLSSFGIDCLHNVTQDASGMFVFPEGSIVTTEMFKKRFDEIEKNYSINKLRIERNKLLKDCDWTMMTDVNLENKDEWILYRQVLRDLPESNHVVNTDINGNIIDYIFPKIPN